ncbi:peptidylprolyl isomerase [Magnetospirillum sulfuroxidans]|uniref:Parvulin-like PPIase n=1 Tax=Magnetospirillum sulfuroxidans TaxID=611300 RepID=A0ABS5IFU2_9PROT|nr:peptidylprolyl isomerase [Magnetospirillum sulfuroxidans]MBR9973281.1 peptidylprolyl isomerase [Magnetospirillum sulfuroxidans]
MFFRFVFLCLMAGAFSLCALGRAQAQMLDRVVAVVNDEAISFRDLDARMRLALVSSNIPDSQDSRKRMLPQVLRKMIDERLQLQEAQRLGIVLSNSDVDGAIAMVEQQSRMPRGALLANLGRQGVDPTRVRDQIRADLTWMRLVTRVVGPQIRIGDEEVNDRLQSISERQGLREVRAAEIFLPVESHEQEDETRQLGEKLLEGLHQGTPFASLARQFSRSPTSSNGGQLGWVSQGMVDEEVAAVLENLGHGQTSPLVRTATGYYLLTVLETRIVGQSVSAEDSTVTVSRLILPVPAGAPPKQELLERAFGLTRNAKSCAELDALATKAGAAIPTRQGPIRIGELPPELKNVVAALPPNQAGPPLDTPEGIIVPMVCSRQDALVATPPTAAQIRRQIEDERRDMLARRYLRNLRRAAFVDVRM